MVQPYVIKSLPGIKRDGTRLENGFYVDGQWCRFQRGLPRKMGGYRTMTHYMPQISRGVTSYATNGYLYLHTGGSSTLSQFTVDQYGNASIFVDRTPVALTPNANNMWTFDTSFDSVGVTPGSYIFAHAGQNLNDIDNSVASTLFWGIVSDSSPLVANTAPSVSGGVVSLYPYVFVYGSDGYVAWCVPNSPNDWVGTGSGDAYITAQKIVAALPLRAGAGNSPAGLFWSLDSLIRVMWVGGDTIFQYDTLSSQSSIMSSQCVIEYDGIFYWAGTDRFLSFNGVVREVPNQLNQNWFFDNINYNYRQKVFAFKIPRYGEIWWCYPRGNATECTHAVIYNVRENTWYDTALPNSGRSAGQIVNVYEYPIMMGIDQDSVTGQYKVWQHESGYDEIDGSVISPVDSYFQTADLALVADPNQPRLRALRCTIVEPDFVQSGDMTCQITGRVNARSPEVTSEAKTFPETANTPEEQVVFFKETRREMRFIFRSNTVGGNYQMGQCIAHVDVSDGTYLG